MNSPTHPDRGPTPGLTRRSFLAATASVTPFLIVPRRLLAGSGDPPPSEQLNLACIGVGGKGYENALSVSTENIVALCDVDTRRAARAFSWFSQARPYRDFVLLLEFRMPTISDSGISFRRLIPRIPGFGDQEQFNLRSRGGMGHLESYYFLPPDTARDMGLEEAEKPHVRHIDPEVGVWHTVKLTLQGRTFSVEYDGEVLYDRFAYHDWMLSLEPAPISLQKHIVVHGDHLGATNPCPIEYRNVFIRELQPGASVGAPTPSSPPRAPATRDARRPSSPNAKLLAELDARALPAGYDAASHQAYVDARMAGLSDAQRSRIGQLWEENQRIDPQMPNRGASFVKIMEHVAGVLPAELPLWGTPPPEPGPWAETSEQVRSEQPPPGSPSGFNRVFSSVSVPTYSLHRPPHPNGVGLVICPGGGFRDVWLDREGHDLALRLKPRGIASLVLKYRTRPAREPDSAEDEAAYQRAVQADAWQAVRLLRSRAVEWGVDPAKIGLCGFSAGGHLALTCALGAEPPGPPDRVSGLPDFAGLFYPGIPADAVQLVERRAAAGPQGRGLCPMFIINAHDDQVTPTAPCLELYAALLMAGAPAELHVFGKGSHGFDLGTGRSAAAALWPEGFVAWLYDAGLMSPPAGRDRSDTLP